ncbi:hypothetical protein SAMN04487996_105219 [Dyadobacter soli]|uniref:Uncharacterized protein n=1 Tax=Dyadobacter soli TaxID=659014 RepID=A0A1G7DGP8_9BACT|nr:hypothetical protein [Dyadobacter soli]SDE50210.1 hypothetical protein SAMN04487996_105219 [Dyadobacter soli]
MKKLLLFFSLILVFSCKDKTVSSTLEVCGVKDPVRNLPWLKAKIDSSKSKKAAEMLTITLAKIKGETVFNYSTVYMSCIGCVAFHCDGTRLDPKKYTPQEMQDYMNTILGDGTRGPVIWPEK